MTSTIIGATKASPIEENVNAADLEIPDEVLEKLDKLFPMPVNGPPS